MSPGDANFVMGMVLGYVTGSIVTLLVVMTGFRWGTQTRREEDEA